MILYGHPFSSYTWKAQIAFYEKEVAHEFRAIETEPPFTPVSYTHLDVYKRQILCCDFPR